jgi:RNA recognition motif-containing protein
MNIYVGNLLREVTEDDLRKALKPEVTICQYYVTSSGGIKRIGFVEMPQS